MILASILTTAMGTVFVVGVVLIVIKMVRSADEPVGWVLAKGVISVALILLTCWRAATYSGVGSAVGTLLLMGFTGALMAAFWTRTLLSFIGDAFASIYGSGEGEHRPALSIAEARRKRGLYQEALEELERQREVFPDELELQMMIAEVHAKDLKDVATATAVIDEIAGQSHPDDRIAIAYNRLADWQMKIDHDPDAARDSLQRIVARFPGSRYAHQASTRIAHLPTRETYEKIHDSGTIEFVHRDSPTHVSAGASPQPSGVPTPIPATPVGAAPARSEAGDLVRHLEQHPDDHDARERLAIAYAHDFHRIDLVRDQLEPLIQDSTYKSKQRIGWIDRLAELELDCTGDIAVASATIKRISALFPGTAAADRVPARLHQLKVQAKNRHETRAIKMGSYEKNIGLKQSS